VAAPSLQTGCHQFRNHFGYYLEQAAAGHEIEISRRGRPYARLVPATEMRPDARAIVKASVPTVDKAPEVA
jgi:prevent-host-death family protein